MTISRLGTRGATALFAIVTLGALVAPTVTAYPAVPSASPPTSAASSSTGVPTNQWPEAHGNQQLTGLSADSSISTDNAPQLGVRWMTNLVSQSLSSPVVAYNATLGKTVVYAGTENGWFSAYNEATGTTLWSVDLGSAIRSTPVIDGPYVWVDDAYSPRLFKLNASTGAALCSAPLYAVGEASPVVATPPGGQPSIFFGANDAAANGPIDAFSESDCTRIWEKYPYPVQGGVWDMMSYAIDAPTPVFPSGEPLVIFGTSDPDGAVYALDANTGKTVWRFQTDVVNSDSDVGAGVSVALPGANGFPDGVAYTAGKDGVAFAINLTTGALIWKYAFENPPALNGSRSTPAVVGNQVVFGSSEGTFDLNATTGALQWHYVLPTGDENLGAVAIEGPPGKRVVLTTNLNGQFQVLSLASGKLLYSYQTGFYVASSPAIVGQDVVFAGADGFLYDFSPHGGNNGSATTAITSPAPNSVLAANPGSVLLKGTASDPAGVNHVQVAVQMGGQYGEWWSAPQHAWQPGPFINDVSLADKGVTSTMWSLSVPAPASGTTFQVWSAAVGKDQIADTSSNDTTTVPSRESFTVPPNMSSPTLVPSAPRAAPGSSLTLTGGGYEPNETLSVSIATTPPTQLATVVTGTNTGGPNTAAIPSTTVTIPTTMEFGPVSLTAVAQTSSDTGTASVIISNNWEELGDNAQRTGTEVNDNEIINNVAPQGKYFFDQAYNFPADSPIRTSPAIDNGMAFFGDDNGSFYAVDVHTGVPVWQDTYAGKIDSSPAVDSGVVFFGTEAGSVVAVDEHTGSAIWSMSTGGAVESSPAVSGGVVYVGSDDGTLYALRETDGTILWHVPLGGGPIHSSPAIDSTAGIVVVGDDSGFVIALDATAGTILWSYQTGGAVTATPMVTGGNVFVGSHDGSEYDLSEGTKNVNGLLVWKYATNGPIVSNTASVPKRVVFGSEDWTLYYLDSSKGVLTSSLATGSAIMGIAGSPRIVVATLQDGVAIGNRIGGTETTWKDVGDGVGFASSPVINDGAVYITGLDDNLHVFDAPGHLIY